MLEIHAFRSDWFARSFIRFQGWTTREAKVRRFHWPEHPWANRRGNVVVVQKGSDPGGAKFVFADGSIRYRGFHGLPA